jgi:hypothetical protein
VSRRGSSGRPEAEGASYEVGYGKPPKAFRFKPGTSGNPGGRPKGSGRAKADDAVVLDQMKALLLEEAYRPIQIRDGEKRVTVPVMQAVIRSLALNAAKGQPRSQRMLIDLIGAVEGGRRSDREKLFEAVIEYKDYWEQQIARARQTGVPEPTPLPHPDSLVVDAFAGSVFLRGPWNEEEKAICDRLIALREQTEKELQEARTKRTRASQKSQDQIAADERLIKRCDRLLNLERTILRGARTG